MKSKRISLTPELQDNIDIVIEREVNKLRFSLLANYISGDATHNVIKRDSLIAKLSLDIAESVVNSLGFE